MRCHQSRWQPNRGRNPLSDSPETVQTNRATSQHTPADQPNGSRESGTALVDMERDPEDSEERLPQIRNIGLSASCAVLPTSVPRVADVNQAGGG